MRMRVISLVAVCLTSYAVATASTVQQLVDQSFPPALAVDQDGPIPAEDRQSDYVVSQLDPAATEVIVAGYCNGNSGGLSVISTSGTVLAMVTPKGMSGSRIAVRVLDLDGDGKQEIIASLGQPRGLPVAWIYRWANNTLTLLSPTKPIGDCVTSDLTDPTFLKLSSQGPLAILDHKSWRGTTDRGDVAGGTSHRLYAWSGGKLVQSDSQIDYVTGYIRGTSTPTTQDTKLTVDAATPPRDLLVVNGDELGAHRVTSAELSMNGQSVLQPQDFSEQVASIRVPVGILAGQNTLSVRLTGKPDSRITIVLLAH